MRLSAVLSSCLAVCLLCLCLVLAPSSGRAQGITCSFYDIAEVPEGWKVSMTPGFNNAQGRSLGHYYNRDKNCSVMIQVSEKEKPELTLDDIATMTVEGLRKNGCSILAEPVRDGELFRLEATLTGTPTTIWIGTSGEFVSLTAISGDRAECRLFLSSLSNANPQLIPGAEKVQP